MMVSLREYFTHSLSPEAQHSEEGLEVSALLSYTRKPATEFLPTLQGEQIGGQDVAQGECYDLMNVPRWLELVRLQPW